MPTYQEAHTCKPSQLEVQASQKSRGAAAGIRRDMGDTGESWAEDARHFGVN